MTVVRDFIATVFRTPPNNVSLPTLGLAAIVRSHVKTDAGDVYVCTKPICDYARQAMILDIAIVVGVSLLYWRGQLPGQ